MGHGEHSISDLLVYAVAFSIAAAIAFAPQKASSGSYDINAPIAPGARWSNDRHLADGLIVGPDCVTLPGRASAEYVPGRDAWGRPVPPADSHTGVNNFRSIPMELDVHLGRKKLAGKSVELSSGPTGYDPGQNTVGGYPIQRDCTPYFK